MKIFSAAQIRAWDQFTISNEPVSSIDLMERAASRCFEWLMTHFPNQQKWIVFCGTGNNGGDGLVIARKLFEAGKKVQIYVNGDPEKASPDCTINFRKATGLHIPIHVIRSHADLPIDTDQAILIDALFGTGLNKPLSGLSADLVAHINTLENTVISIDLPSGMFADQPSAGAVIRADYTLSFQRYKLAFLVPENSGHTGEVIILDIGLSKAFEAETNSDLRFVETDDIRRMYRRRDPFVHKGSMGHAALIAGSWGMMGAAMLAARACLRSGAGKLTCFVTPECYPILQAWIPEAIFVIDQPHNFYRYFTGKHGYSSVGIGPGTGLHDWCAVLLETLFGSGLPLVLDADALNHISRHPSLLQKISTQAILTPHVKEFERLFGPVQDGFERIRLAQKMAGEHRIHIILKGHYSLTADPAGIGFFNPTGNPGMATAGSGDVLTGILTGLLAQGFTLIQACLMGNFLHGLSGDLALRDQSPESLIASDLISALGRAFNKIAKTHPEI